MIIVIIQPDKTKKPDIVYHGDSVSEAYISHTKYGQLFPKATTILFSDEWQAKGYAQYERAMDFNKL